MQLQPVCATLAAVTVLVPVASYRSSLQPEVDWYPEPESLSTTS